MTQENETYEIMLIDAESGEPMEDGSIILNWSEYSLIETLAQEQEISFEETFKRAVYKGVNLIKNTQKFRFTVAETQGAKRSYSYLLKQWAPVGTYTEASLPEELESELEGFSQSSDMPPFLYAPDGELHYSVTVED